MNHPSSAALLSESPHSRVPVATPALGVEQIDHVGIRVVEEARAVEFYGWFGFHVVQRIDADFPLVVLLNKAGVELHLVITAAPSFDGRNVLADLPEKHPGFNHLALRVASVEAAAAALRQLGVRITDGPRRLGPSLALIARDPDANVIELRERAEPSASDSPSFA
jgi:lactoylglutathione lyase